MIIQYRAGDSFLHRLNPLSKLAVVAVYSIIIFLLFSWKLELVALAAILLLERAIGSRDVTRLALSRYSLGLFFSIVFLGSLWSATGGRVYFTIPLGWTSLAVTDTAVQMAVVNALRYFTVILLGGLYIITTSPSALVYSLMRAGIPYRLGFMLVLMLRFAPVLEDELETVHHAQRLRGIEPKVSTLRRLPRLLRFTLIPLLVSTLSRVDALVVSMEGRAFGHQRTRTFVEQDHYGWIDKLLIAVSLLLLGLMVANFATHWIPNIHLMPGSDKQTDQRFFSS